MFSITSNGNQTQPSVDWQKHCILVAASNPYSLPTPVSRPSVQKMEQSDSAEVQSESRLSDAETVAKSFSQVGETVVYFSWFHLYTFEEMISQPLACSAAFLYQ